MLRQLYTIRENDVTRLVLVTMDQKFYLTNGLEITGIHKDLEITVPHIDIMGAYILQDDLGKKSDEIPILITYYNKQLHTDGTGSDLHPVTWWILRQRGICVYGQDIELSYEVKMNTLVQYVKENMNSYWLSWIDRLSKLLNSPGPEEIITKAQM